MMSKLTTQEVEQALRKENIEFPTGRIESKDIDLTIKLDKAYQKIENYYGYDCNHYASSNCS